MSGDAKTPTTPELLRAGLSEIRATRRLAHLPLLCVIVLIFLFRAIRDNVPAFEGSFWDKLSLALIGVAFLVANVLMFTVSVINLRCPRCRKFFHGGRYRNDFARKCLNCGLKLNGSNAGDAP